MAVSQNTLQILKPLPGFLTGARGISLLRNKHPVRQSVQAYSHKIGGKGAEVGLHTLFYI